MDDGELIAEQVAYYRARAAEYDATSMPEGDPYAAHGNAIRDALRAFEPRGRVLEIAAGTGQWTPILAEHADELVVTDASPEMLELNRAKHPADTISYDVADAFRLPATHDFDVAFFGFFLSHVPPRHFEAFWNVVAGVLTPAGRVFFVDEGRHFEWREDWVDEAAGVVRRPLTDGSVHRAVKVLWRPADLEARLTKLGWDASVRTEGPFYWGTASR
ncbi:MAG TPA: class I SAM-dependent methyltransferase [Candidatus Limnocylindria bacterium]|nr:class I SAM-dependent methyltransferase [Candidatus Limnocylindria bacterium]